jgi:hypothetical protein
MLGKALLGLAIYWNWACSPSALPWPTRAFAQLFAHVSPDFLVKHVVNKLFLPYT